MGDGYGMIVAEAVTFDPGFVVAILVLFALACAIVIATVACGIVAGYRFGIDHDRVAARTMWIASLALAAVGGVLVAPSGDPSLLGAYVGCVGSMIAARWVGEAVGSSRSDLEDRRRPEQDPQL